MESLHSTSALYFSLTFLFFNLVTSSFSPIDHYLINCGSNEPTTVDFDHRFFTGDESESVGSLLTSTGSVSLTDPNPSSSFSPIYHTGRFFTKPSKYKFDVKERGTHLVRLHFRQLRSDFDFSDAQFHVLANGYVLFSSSGVDMGRDSEIVKDYMIWVDSDLLVITFVPTEKSKFAFVNAIEVISAPKDLVADVAQHVNSHKNVQIDGLLKSGLETLYRINVGGWKVTPFNDSLWRTWVTDDEYLKSNHGSSKFHFSGRINYQDGGASREVGPDNVYNTARVIRSSDNSIPDLNITWNFPVIGGYKYLVRMHFCDIASVARGMLFFNVYVNNNLAYENLDLTSVTNGLLASPFYADFVVDGDDSGVLTLSVGPSNMSLPRAVDAILNGVEIMKMNNSAGSFDGDMCAHYVLKNWRSGNDGMIYPMLAAVFLLMMAFVFMHRRRTGATDSGTWFRLPTEISEDNLKYNNQLSSNKV